MTPAFFDRPAQTVAPDLIGARLLVDGVGGRIVETEAYDAQDPASHSFRGPTPRNAPMFGPPGGAYVYRIYGRHWCFNIVCGAASLGGAVLVRALEPTERLDMMHARRGVAALFSLCSGPGRVCQALGIDGRLNGQSVLAPPFAMSAAGGPVAVVQGPRVGIRVATGTPWRFAEAGSRFVSRPRPAA